jgi:hypothetical protein
MPLLSGSGNSFISWVDCGSWPSLNYTAALGCPSDYPQQDSNDSYHQQDVYDTTGSIPTKETNGPDYH